MKKKSTEMLPPNQDSLDMHAHRVKYQAYDYLNFENHQAPPTPTDHEWKLIDGKCIAIRYCKSAMPQFLQQSQTLYPQQTLLIKLLTAT
jgi:hypothetical protein